MQLICLGGAAAWPNPGQGCSSYLVKEGDSSVLLDCGPDTLLELRKHTALRDVNAVVISHSHSDHILDLVAYRYAMVYSKENGGDTQEPTPLWLPPDGISRLQALGDALAGQGEAGSTFWEPSFELREYDPDEVLTAGSMQIRFHRTQHFTPCYAMRVSGIRGSDLVYGADTGAYEPLVEFSKDAGLLIAEATMNHEWIENPEEQGHISPEQAAQWATEAHVSCLVLTHLWSERPEEEVLSKAGELYAGPISIAKPGLTIHV